jgi:glycosyltransferase involved in cell wall biosynthesis
LANTFTRDKRIGAFANALTPPVELEVGLLTGGIDKPYAFGLAMALISKGVCLDFIGSDEVDSPEFHTSPKVRFLNLRGDQRRDASLATRICRILIYYARLIRYTSVARPKIFHILWNNKFQIFDRTLLMLYYKLQGKMIVFTAHNVNAGKRDLNDSLLNRLTLRVQYQLADHIFVHTERMKSELLQDFSVSSQAVSVIPFGINNAVPRTDLTPQQARRRLGISEGKKTILFFGRIAPYKGLHFLVTAFQRIVARNPDYRLIIAGQPKKGAEKYLDEVLRTISYDIGLGRVIQKIQYIPDEETEVYFKSADILVVPYSQIFQSGVLFLGYSFGLPAIATEVGSFSEDIIEGMTGYLCKACDAVDLAKTIETYFESDLFKTLDSRRQEIRDHAIARHSWGVVGEMTMNVYAKLGGISIGAKTSSGPDLRSY